MILNLEHPWDMSDRDPIQDMKAAIKRLEQPPDYKAMGEMERQVNQAIQLLTDAGKSPEEIEALLVKYGVWPGR
jgi:hypothetical protein